jgi:riboflavin synthase alpha subunit
VLRFDPVGDNRLLEILAPKAIAKFIARKGSITVNGTSLTTNEVSGQVFTINLIPAHAGKHHAESAQAGEQGQSGGRSDRPLLRTAVER